jgi:lysophospholipase L1-like esterase
MSRLLLLSLFALSTVGRLFAADSAFYLHDGDRVVFYGDSITDQRLYTVYTELFTVTRYPATNVTFVHSGWGGDRVSGGGGGPVDLRLQRDVRIYKPTVVTIMLGMNDGHYTSHKPEDDQVYQTGFRHIIGVLRKEIPGVRITAIEPSPFDDVTRPFTLQPDGYNAVLVSYGHWIEDYSKESNLDVADLNSGVVAVLKNATVTDNALAQKIVPDRVHPGSAGHLLMAEQLLKAWHARPIVSSVTLAAGATPKVQETQFAQVTNLTGANGLRWEETEDSLPLPLVPMTDADTSGAMALALKSSDLAETLNQETLRVSGLAPGNYTLRIDGKGLGNFTDTQLGAGINLGSYRTPMAEQSFEVLNLTILHNNIHTARWRQVQFPLQDKNLDKSLASFASTLAAMDQLEADLVRLQREAAKPKSHQFELTTAP